MLKCSVSATIYTSTYQKLKRPIFYLTTNVIWQLCICLRFLDIKVCTSYVMWCIYRASGKLWSFNSSTCTSYYDSRHRLRENCCFYLEYAHNCQVYWPWRQNLCYCKKSAFNNLNMIILIYMGTFCYLEKKRCIYIKWTGELGVLSMLSFSQVMFVLLQF